MLSLLRRQIAHKLPCNARCFSAAEVSDIAPSSTPTAPASAQSRPSLSFVRDKKREYFVPRNTRGNLPVYTDVRNAGSRHLVLIRNIEGNASALARDLNKSLFEPDSHEASRLKIQFNHSRHLTISGGRWKEEVVAWLKNEGF